MLLKQVLLVKAFLISRANLLQELKNLSKAINQTIDLSGLTSQHDESETESPNVSKVCDFLHLFFKLCLILIHLLYSSTGSKWIH